MRGRSTAIIVAALAGVLATLAAYLAVCMWEFRVGQIDFESKAKGSLQVLNADLADASTLLSTLAAFIGSNHEPVTADEFRDFSAELHGRVAGMRDTAWAPRVQLADRPAFERAARAAGFAAFTITEFGPHHQRVPAAKRPRYYPILYIETGGKRPPVQGFDLISDANVSRTVLRALRFGRPAATPPMDVMSVSEAGAGILSYMPVYPSRSRGNRDRTVMGFVLGVFDLAVLIKHHVTRNPSAAGLHIFVFNPLASGDRRRIYETVAPGQPATESGLLRGVHWQSSIRIIDQQLDVIVTPAIAPTFLSRSLFGLTTLVLGSVMTAMIVAYLIVSLRRTLGLEALTASLESTTRRLQEKVEQVDALSRHDVLTGMPNRRLFHERLDEAFSRFGRGSPFALLFLDLDRFKEVNDKLGHRTGDDVLCEVGRRIGSCIRPVDTAARLGGDEFAIILATAWQEAEIALVAHRLIESISNPYEVAGKQISIGVSIGAAIVASNETPDTIVAEADHAMFHAKKEGRSFFHLSEKSAALLRSERPLPPAMR